MADKYIFSWYDFDKDRQQVSFDVLEAGGSIADYQAWKTEFDKWTAGSDGEGGFFEILVDDSGVASSNPVAQSRSQAIIELEDSVNGKVFKKRLPFPNLTKANDAQTPPEPAFVRSGGLTVFNPDHTDYGTLKSAIENTAVTPDGNSALVSRIYIEE